MSFTDSGKFYDFPWNKSIEEIKAGDIVYSTDPETGESDYKEVIRAFRKESDVIIHIFVNGEEIETTPNHPFWVEDEWVLAKDLREGDVLSLAYGTTAVITKAYGEQFDEPVIVYNFEVKDFHTYYVTGTGVLVHNNNCTDSVKPLQEDESKAVQPYEVTTYEDFRNRSVVGDGLEGHEMWQHSNLKNNGYSTTRLSTDTSKNNPVMALPHDVHVDVNRQQYLFDGKNQTPFKNIIDNANIMYNNNDIPNNQVTKQLIEALKLLENTRGH